MYRKIYQILEETGKVKTAMVLNGNHKGEKCLIKENHCVSFAAYHFWRRTCFAACCKNRENAGISCDCYG